MAETTGGQGRSEQRPGLLAREALILLLTLAIGVVLLTLLVLAPRMLYDRNGRPMPPSVPVYLGNVREYLVDLAGGSLGRTNRGRSVNSELLEAARRSLELLAISFAVALSVGLGWGALLAGVRRRWLAALLFGLSTLLLSLPSFLVMLLATEGVATLTFRTGIQLTYVQGYGLDRHLILPTLVLGLRGAAFVARSTQVAHEEIMRQDWLRAARARGLGGFTLWRRHVLPALRLPLLGISLGMLRTLVGGLVIIDYVYGWGGLGRKMLQVNFGIVSAANDEMILGAAVLLLCFFVLIDALGRLLLRGADPRLSEQGIARE
ncbi:MAG TPA: ABC transporter permease [Roseiflexaceae bacterium]|nr:ABC transporter permease [Roseiflexaceae bacterium]